MYAGGRTNGFIFSTVPTQPHPTPTIHTITHSQFPNNHQACDRAARPDKALEVGEAMLAAGVVPLRLAVALVLRGAHRGMLYDRVRGWRVLLWLGEL